MVTIFLPLAASLFCMSAGLGNLAVSQVKYLQNNKSQLSPSSPPPSLISPHHYWWQNFTSFHPCVQYQAKERHKECHARQIHYQHCVCVYVCRCVGMCVSVCMSSSVCTRDTAQKTKEFLLFNILFIIVVPS